MKKSTTAVVIVAVLGGLYVLAKRQSTAVNASTTAAPSSLLGGFTNVVSLPSSTYTQSQQTTVAAGTASVVTPTSGQVSGLLMTYKNPILSTVQNVATGVSGVNAETWPAGYQTPSGTTVIGTTSSGDLIIAPNNQLAVAAGTPVVPVANDTGGSFYDYATGQTYVPLASGGYVNTTTGAVVSNPTSLNTGS